MWKLMDKAFSADLAGRMERPAVDGLPSSRRNISGASFLPHTLHTRDPDSTPRAHHEDSTHLGCIRLRAMSLSEGWKTLHPRWFTAK